VQELEDSKTKLAEEAEELEQRVDKAKDAAAELQVRVYSLYWYKRTHTDAAAGQGRRRGAPGTSLIALLVQKNRF
jgi:hypothetical protein